MMDPHSLEVLEYPALLKVLSGYCGSDLARGLVEHLQPSTDRERLSISLAQTDEARALLDRGSSLPVGGLRDMAKPVHAAHAEGRALEPEDLLLVLEMLQACRGLADFLAEEDERSPQLHELGSRLQDHTDLEEAIAEVVERPGRVKDRASPRLWEIRRQRRELEEKVRALMNDLAAERRLRPHLQERSWSVRNGRFVLPVKMEARGYVPGVLHDKSQSGGTLFIEPKDVVASANRLTELEVDESREVTRILLELSRTLFAVRERLAYTQSVAAWLAFTSAKADMSADLDLVSARLTEQPSILLRHAKHPLLLMEERNGRLPSPLVPCSLELGADFRMLVVTGPNTGGKTVTLKLLGLIQLMFQSGLHVPAAPGTELPCLRDVLADIGDEQSLSQSLSTFSGHVANVVRILERAAPDALVLLDELGAGTDPLEGAALGQAILQRLLASGSRVAVTTHLGMLKGFAYAHEEVENASVAFDMETLSPTYELLVGQPGASQALAIAARHGMPKDVVAAAETLRVSESDRQRELMEQLETSRIAAERSRRKSLDLEQRSREELAHASRARAEAEDSRAKLEREAESELDRILDAIRERSRAHLNALKNVPKGLVSDVEALRKLLHEERHTQAFADRRSTFLAALKKHDEVYVPRFEAVCRIEKLNRAEERLSVRVGALRMDIDFDEVSWVTPPEARRESKKR